MMKLKAKIYQANTPNANGYTYTEEALQSAVKAFSKREHQAVGGEYPPTISTHDANVSNIIGVATVEYEDGYVVATIVPYTSGETKFKEAIRSCNDIKVMPVGGGRLESVDNLDMIIRTHLITRIVCTCEEVNCGGVGEEMFVAEIIDDK